MKMIKKIFILLCLLMTTAVFADDSTVFKYTVNKPLDEVYQHVYEGLEKEGFYVVFEVNIGRNVANFADKWGAEFNKNKLSGFRSMVFCNGWYANQVSNLDPDMLALCPMRMTLIEKEAKTTALFARPTVIAANSPALKILQRLESEVIAAITTSMQK